MNYMFHRNVQNGKVEFANKPQNGLETIWKTLTQGAINSIMVMFHIIKSFLSRLLEGGMREV
jgi:hypothetical protein